MDNHFDFKDEYFSFSLAIKFAISVSMFIILIVCTVSEYHSREIKINRISMLPYYTMIGQAIFMIFYYGLFGLFDLREKVASVYSISRAVLSTPT